MKINLEFDLPDEQDDFEIAVRAPRLISAVIDWDNWAREIVKYKSDQYDEKYVEAINDARTALWQELSDREVGELFC